MSKTLEQRLEALEVSFEEVKKVKCVPGPRGPAGPIDAVVENAKQAVADAESRVQTRADATYREFAAEVKELREEVFELKQFLDERIKNAVELHTVQVLED